MYQEKSFQARPIEDIIDELDTVKTMGGSKYVRDVFLADGDAMTLPTGALEKILDVINEKLPRVRRISILLTKEYTWQISGIVVKIERQGVVTRLCRL